MTLFDIVGEYNELYSLATSEEEQAEQVFIDTLDSIMGEIETKSEGYIAVINRLDMEQKKAKEVADTYSAIARSRDNAIKKMKERLLYALETMGKNELAAGDFTIKIKANGGVAPLIIDGNVPDNMTKVTVEPDNKKIREYLKDNTCDWAHIAERGRHIEIK